MLKIDVVVDWISDVVEVLSEVEYGVGLVGLSVVLVIVVGASSVVVAGR